MFGLNQDSLLLPMYNISPFTTEDIAQNDSYPEDNFASQYFDNRFGENNWTYTFSGREAIGLALENYNLQPNDLVTILTTSENFYISSCVTLEIETVCRWNRELTPETKIIFVNHEFGYPHPEMDQIVNLGLPIIEDCCTTFFSQDTFAKVGHYGDYAVFSFPKFFPMQLGGLIISNKSLALKESRLLEENQIKYIQNILSFHLKNENQLLQKRHENWKYALKEFSKLGFTPRFATRQNTVPSVLLLNNNEVVKDLNAFKIYLYDKGIQNSIFYGEDAFFIPSHQNLETKDYDYFLNCIAIFLQQQ